MSQPVRDVCLATMIDLGGGKFQGCQEGFCSKDGEWIEPLAIFLSPKTGTSLALPVSKVSAQAVREHIAESDAKFEPFQEKASLFVFRDFGQPRIEVEREVANERD